MRSAGRAFDVNHWPMNQQTKIDIRHSTCPHDCPSACALDVEVIDGSWAIVRTGGMPDIDLCLLVHGPMVNIKSPARRAHLSGNAAAKTATRHALCAEIGPAIDVDGLAVDIACGGAAEEAPRRRDVFRPAALAGDGLVGQMMRGFGSIFRPWRADQA